MACFIYYGAFLEILSFRLMEVAIVLNMYLSFNFSKYETSRIPFV